MNIRLIGWRSWGITTRLVVIATVPALAMFLAVTLALYLSSRDEVNNDVQVRGRLIAAALAESSHFAVVSGNVSELERMLKGLLSAGQGIRSIEIANSQHKPIATGLIREASATGAVTFEHPIQTQTLNANLFDNINTPHLSSETETQKGSTRPAIAGYVRVVMSPAALFEAKRDRMYISVGIVLMATLVSWLIGLALTHRLRKPIDTIVGALRAIRRGKYEICIDTGAEGELGELQNTIAEMAKNLNATRQDLESQVENRTSELREAINLIREADAEKRRLIAHGDERVEEERRRIAIEIHDSLNATLISIRLWAADIASKAAAGESSAEIEAIAARISATTDDLYSSTRSIVKRLRPEIIDTLGFRGAVEEIVRHYDQVIPGCQFELRADPNFPKLHGQLAITAYRLTQEALSNVVKHSHATHAYVALNTNLIKKSVQIIIADNGCGFDIKTKPTAGFGLIGMRERVMAADGILAIDKNMSGIGTRITIKLPAADDLPPSGASG